MRDHVRILAYLHIVFGSLGLVGALIVLLVFGGIAGIVGMANPNDPDALHVAVPIIGVVGFLICAFVALVSIPGIIAGVGLLKFRPWARMLGIVLSALDLLHVPLGTILGIYGLWVLLKPETEQLFAYTAQPQTR
ncbi:MAG: hypothetical protein ACE141_06220 [Bryobacteraceae bacterium]